MKKYYIYFAIILVLVIIGIVLLTNHSVKYEAIVFEDGKETRAMIICKSPLVWKISDKFMGMTGKVEVRTEDFTSEFVTFSKGQIIYDDVYVQNITLSSYSEEMNEFRFETGGLFYDKSNAAIFTNEHIIVSGDKEFTEKAYSYWNNHFNYSK